VQAPKPPRLPPDLLREANRRGGLVIAARRSPKERQEIARNGRFRSERPSSGAI